MIDYPDDLLDNNKTAGRSPMTISPTFCAFPFTHLVIHNDGTYGPCCGASEQFYVDNNIIKSNKMYGAGYPDKSYKPYGLGIQEAFNSEPMEHIRQELLKGNRPSACAKCWNDEDRSPGSKRIGNNALYFALKPEFKGIFDYDSTEISTNTYVRSLDLKFTNKCNLHCLMCTVSNSDQWEQLDEKIKQYLTHQKLNDQPSLFVGADHLLVNPGKSFTDFPQELFEEIKLLVPQLREIQCTGGEPFVSKKFIELLEYAVETGHAEHIALEITTNGTKFVTDVMELLVHFKHIRFIISMDGIEGTYEYIRAPFKYSMLIERLKVLNEYIESGKINAMVNIAIVGMSYNLFDYYNFKEVRKFLPFLPDEIDDFINLNMFLYNDDHPLHVKWLPDDLLYKALEHYLTLLPSIEKMRPNWFRFLSAYVKQETVDPAIKLHNQRRMKNYTLLMDKMLNRDYHDFLDPRLVEFLDTIESDL